MNSCFVHRLYGSVGIGIGLEGLADGAARRKWKKQAVDIRQVINYQYCLIIQMPTFFIQGMSAFFL